MSSFPQGTHILIRAYLEAQDRARETFFRQRAWEQELENRKQRQEEISRHNQEQEKAAKDRIKQQEARDTALANYQKGQLDLATKGRKLEQLTKGADLLSKGVLQIPTRQFVPGQDVPVGNELNQLDEFGNVPEGTTRLDRESLGAALAQMGLDEDVAFNIANLSSTPEQLEAQKLRAKVNEAESMTPILAKRAVEIKKGTLPWEIQAEIDKYNKVTAARDEQLFQNNLRLADNNNAYRLRIEGIKSARKKEATTEKPIKLTAGQQKELRDYNEAEKLFMDIADIIKDTQFGERATKGVTKGKVGGWVNELFRSLPESVVKRDPTVERLRTALGSLNVTIAHPLFGSSFTGGEKSQIQSFLPTADSTNSPTTFRAQILSGLDFVRRKKQDLISTATGNSITKPTPRTNPEVYKEF